jgi:hypothetical protein
LFRDHFAVLQIVSDPRIVVRHALPGVTKPDLNQIVWDMILSQKRVAESAEGMVSSSVVPCLTVSLLCITEYFAQKESFRQSHASDWLFDPDGPTGGAKSASTFAPRACGFLQVSLRRGRNRCFWRV